MRNAPVMLAFAALALAAGAAQAHPRLLAANPPSNGRVAAPAQLRLTFSERLVGPFSKLALSDAAGRPVRVGPSGLSPDRHVLAARVTDRLAPGSYRLVWRATSVDGHKVDGAYGFTVAR